MQVVLLFGEQDIEVIQVHITPIQRQQPFGHQPRQVLTRITGSFHIANRELIDTL